MAIDSTGKRTKPDSTGPVGLMLALTFSTGLVDAVGFLGMDRVFVGNMTGNVVILAMGMAGANDLPVLGPALALGAFLLGALACGRLLRGRPSGWELRGGLVLVSVGLVLAGVAAVVATVPEGGHGLLVGCSTAIAGALGAQAAVARNVAVADVTTVVVTSTITGLAADSRWGRASKAPQGRRASAVLLLLLGAVAGAFAVRWHVALGLGCAAVVILVVALVGELWRRGSAAR